MSRDEARTLARHFAAHLRHLREFRGQTYVGAAPLPLRGRAGELSTWPEGQVRDETRVPAPIEAVALRDTPAPSSTRPVAAPRAAVRSAAADPAASRDLAATRAPEIASADPARQTWSSGQVDSARVAADRSPPQTVTATAAPASPATRLPVVTAEAPPTADTGVRDQARAWTAAEKLDYLRRKNIGNCQRCKLAGTRTHIVFGVGDPEADLMFIGEAPGFDEDRSGEPFVGAAGRRLTQWLGRLGLGREQVYIANVLKCRPPGNRDPEPDEVERCSPFLRAQIRAIQPKVIVALGRYAGILMLAARPDMTLREMRTRSWTYQDPSGAHQAALHVTYHPSYVIRRERELPPGQRNPADDTVMADLQQALQKLRTA